MSVLFHEYTLEVSLHTTNMLDEDICTPSKQGLICTVEEFKHSLAAVTPEKISQIERYLRTKF